MSSPRLERKVASSGSKNLKEYTPVSSQVRMKGKKKEGDSAPIQAKDQKITFSVLQCRRWPGGVRFQPG